MTKLLIIGALVLAVFGSAVRAQTLYVSDDLVITFRTGPGPEFAVTRNLSSGDRVEVLEDLPEDGYSRVRLEDGSEGWVLTRYLQPEPTAGLRLENVSRELSAARQRATELEQRVTELESGLESTTEALTESQTSAGQMDAELAEIRAASANALQTRRENESLRRQVDELTSQVQVAAMEIDELRRRERQNWFIIGAAVLLAGVIIGLVAPSLRPKRRSSW